MCTMAGDFISHLQWSYRLRTGSDHEFVRRASAAADWLEELARPSQTVLVVTHGGFRRILAARLVARGWRKAWRQLSYANWSSWELEHD